MNSMTSMKCLTSRTHLKKGDGSQKRVETSPSLEKKRRNRGERNNIVADAHKHVDRLSEAVKSKELNK